MVQILLIGTAAGLASALLFASVTAGTLLAIPLFYAAPLPIMVAALGWSHVAGIVAAVVAAGGLAIAFTPLVFGAFLVGVGLPAWFIAYLALLARPEPSAPDGVEWYPIGRLVFWAAVTGTIVVAVAVLNFGVDYETFRNGLRGAFERILRAQMSLGSDAALPRVGGNDPALVIDLLVAIVPPIAALLSMLTMLINLWLAGRIVRTSGRLPRPWPALDQIALPGFAPLVMIGAFGLSLVGGMIGLVSGLLTACLLLAYALVGFAVIHSATRGINGRGLILTAVWLAVIVFGWTLLIVTMIGLADQLLDLRARLAARRNPPPPPPAPPNPWTRPE